MLPSSSAIDDKGFLDGIRVLEVGAELGEYCGKLLAGLGADVIKVEPPEGEVTRRYGPFLGDEPGLERSLHFWHYNFGKRGITLDLDQEDDQRQFRRLVETADVVLDGRPYRYFEERGLGYDALCSINPGLLFSRISPFGDDGPWKDFKGSDLIHLALGGVMMNCGYDPDPSGFYETPPIAPQMWQSYHIAGEWAAMGILSALYHRASGGLGQKVVTPVHHAVAQQTESDISDWYCLRQVHHRRTCRHSRPVPEAPILAMTKDGRWIYPYRSYAQHGSDSLERTIDVLAKHGAAEDLLEPKYGDRQYIAQPSVLQHINDVVSRFIQSFMFDRDIWRDFQAAGLTWAPVRKPEENLGDQHWRSRHTFLEVERPELGRSFTEVGAKWMCPQVPWRAGPRSPLLGEHNEEILSSGPRVPVTPRTHADIPSSDFSAPALALDGVRYIDLGWLLASAGVGRFLAAQGAEVIKVEHKSRWDGMRHTICISPPEGRQVRAEATGPLPMYEPHSPNRSAYFMDINAGKRAISLNLKKPQAKEILARLIKTANVVGEGFSPGTMDRMGFGYERLKELNPSIVYAQQSGMGQLGTYGAMRSFGPVAQAFSGLSEMSGLPEPFPPAGIGYSYLDWFGAYNMTTAIMAGLYRQKLTGKGCWIDASQVEAGTYLTGTAVLDFSANGRSWARYGNASPYKPAAPHGAFRTRGDDRWIAIACFTEEEWRALLGVLGGFAGSADPRFATLAGRLAHQHDLEIALTAATIEHDAFALMAALQRAGVPAGVCQTAEDRCDYDPQLRNQKWLVELDQAEIGRWPVQNIPVKFSKGAQDIGGPARRHGPNYGQDNEYVYGEILGFSSQQIRDLEDDDVI